MNKSALDFPHVFLLPKLHNQWEADAWCTEKFGKRWSAIDNRTGTWCCFWAGGEKPGHYRWYFTNEQDVVLFLLRWS